MNSNPTIDAPLHYRAEADPAIVGMKAEGVLAVANRFEEQIARGLHPAAQMVVLRHGRVILDRAMGLANVRRRKAATSDTPFLAFSITKPLTGICVHKLVEERRIDLDTPIAAYWPEFGNRGKEKATVRHVLLHQAGIPSRGLHSQLLSWPSWSRVTRNVARLPAEYEPGSQTAYHLVNYGFILGELVRRVTGIPIQQFLREAFLDPLDMRHSWLGLPRAEQSRSARLYAGHAEHRNTTLLFNLPIIRGAVLPAATLHSTARDIAIFFQMLLNGGTYNGRSYLRADTIREATEMRYEGYDNLLQKEVRWGYGFELGGHPPGHGIERQGMGAASTRRTFGHFGNATSMAWADPNAQLVVVFLTNRLLDSPNAVARWKEISDAVWDAIEN